MRFDNLRRKFRDMHVRYGFEEKTSRNLIADLRLTLSRAGRQLLNVMEEGLIEPPEDPGNWLRFALDKESDCLFKSHKHTLVEAQPGMPVGQLLAEDTELKKKTKSQKDDDADAENTQKDDGAKTDKLPMLRTGKFSDLVGWWHTLQPLRSRFGDAGEDLRDREAFIQRHVFIEAVTEWLPRQFSDRFSPIPDLERWNAVTLDGERASFISDWIPICYSDPPGWVDTRKYYKDIDIVGFALPLAEYSAEACALLDEWIAPTSSSVDGAEDPEEAPHSIVSPGLARQNATRYDDTPQKPGRSRPTVVEGPIATRNERGGLSEGHLTDFELQREGSAHQPLADDRPHSGATCPVKTNSTKILFGWDAIFEFSEVSFEPGARNRRRTQDRLKCLNDRYGGPLKWENGRTVYAYPIELRRWLDDIERKLDDLSLRKKSMNSLNDEAGLKAEQLHVEARPNAKGRVDSSRSP